MKDIAKFFKREIELDVDTVATYLFLGLGIIGYLIVCVYLPFQTALNYMSVFP